MAEGDLDIERVVEDARPLRVSRLFRTPCMEKIKVPVTRILTGIPMNKAINHESVANPAAIHQFVFFGETSSSISHKLWEQRINYS